MLRIIFTSDMHGHADMIMNCADSFIKDEHTIIIDGGDTIQGSPLTAYLYNNSIGAEPIAQTLNQSKYDFVTLGNHEFNYGLDYLRTYLNALNATCICANVTGDLPVTPYIIHTMSSGLKVGITGIVTDYVNIWEKAENLKGVSIRPPFDAVRDTLQQMKSEADICICIYHGGFECDITTGEPLTNTTENIGSKICRELDFDVLLTGHQHMPIEGCLHHGTYIVQPGANAKHFIEIIANLHNEKFQFTSRFITPNNSHTREENNHLSAINKDVQKWLDTKIGTLAEPLLPTDRAEMALHGSPIATLFNRIQLEATGTQISCVGLSNNIPGFNRDVRMRDIVENYPFSNNLVTLKITGTQLVTALERVASYLSLDSEGVPVVSKSFLYPKIEHYNYDFFSGLTYTVDLHKPIGGRVSDVKVNNANISPNEEFTICMSSYRATGTGGYEVYTACPIVEYGHQEVSELICDYISRKGNIYVENEEVINWMYI